VPFTPIRRLIAEHLVRSLATAAHTLVVTEVDFSRVDDVRRSQGWTYLPFVARSVIDGLARFPHLNASVVEDGLLVHPRVHLGIAVDLDYQGLVVPVVHDAHELRIAALARHIGDLGERARAHHLTPDEVEGGTFTITNAGAYGTVVTGPIINQPQVAIVSTDGVRMRPVALPDPAGGWQVAVRPVGNLSLSFDHRAVDGAYAAAFLASVREVLEQRDWEAEVE
jgi:pyruvate dehydrogenase E2 component (dihydrolipoamide acetyltransferase)